jgi:hypothetical protein
LVIAKVTCNADLRRLTEAERRELRCRIVCAITNLEAVLAMVRPG